MPESHSTCSAIPILVAQQHECCYQPRGVLLHVSLQVGEHELIEALDVAVLGAEVGASTFK
jgi:hypothetical protein